MGEYRAVTDQPVSVLLPTVDWTDACGELCGQLGPDDELLIVCDTPESTVYERSGELPDGARVVVAGEPEACSGKANAIVTGMEAATNDLVVWTDDDFHHPPDWLDQLRADYERQGPTTEIPLFVGRDPLSYLLEPLYAQVSLFIATPAGNWGGTLIFDRTEDVDEEALLAELRRTISDDATVNEHIDFTTAQRTRRAEMGGSVRESLELHTRFQKIPWRHGSKLGGLAGALVTAVVAVATLVFPILGFAAMTLVYGAIYARLGFSRWTVLLSYLSVLLATPLWVYAITRRTFVWGGRRYRWRSMFDVEVAEH